MTGFLIVTFYCGGLLLIWLAQAAALYHVGEPRVWVAPFRHTNESNFVRMSMKAAIQVVLMGILFGLPLALGLDPIDYHLSWLLSPPLRPILTAITLTITVLGAYQLINVLMGWITLAPKYTFVKTLTKIVKSSFMAWPLAIVEEAMFRGVILGVLLRTFPASSSGIIAAVLVSAVIFSSVHFIRPQKKTIWPAFGLFAFGVVLAIAFVLSNGNCWTSIAIHATGVTMVQMLRPFVSYRAPAWLIGYPAYPICGAMGLLSMAVLSVTLLVVGLSV